MGQFYFGNLITLEPLMKNTWNWFSLFSDFYNIVLPVTEYHSQSDPASALFHRGKSQMLREDMRASKWWQNHCFRNRGDRLSSLSLCFFIFKLLWHLSTAICVWSVTLTQTGSKWVRNLKTTLCVECPFLLLRERRPSVQVYTTWGENDHLWVNCDT